MLVVTVVVVKYTQMVVNLTTQYITHPFLVQLYRNLKLEGKKRWFISITKADGVVLTEKSQVQK
jgi:hypothetical protein